MLLRGNKVQDSLRELREVEELEKLVFGELSINVAKTLKVIGTLLSISGSRELAK